MFDKPQDDVDLPVPIVSEPNYDALEQFAPLKTEDYESFKEDFLVWLATKGKRPFRGDGYADTTVHTTHYKVEMAYRWLWEQEGEYTTSFDGEKGEAFIDTLVTKSPKTDNEIKIFIKCLKRLFKWFDNTTGKNYDWSYSKSDQLRSEDNSKSIHYFRQWELGELYDAALDFGSFKSYRNKGMSDEERKRLTIYLAQRFEKPKEEIGAADFEKANSWKFPSLASMSIDLGLRPIEVGRASVNWLNLSENEVVIPHDESTKNTEPWECALSNRSVNALERWLEERRQYDLYDETDALWVTKYGNPYDSSSLNRLLDNLLERTDVTPGNRDLTWYAIRRGCATMWANNAGLDAAREQLRHKRLKTTMRYVKSESSKRTSIANDLW